KYYGSILPRLDQAKTMGSRLVAAAKTGVTPDDVKALSEEDFGRLQKHWEGGRALLSDYVGFLESGRQALLRQSPFRYYWAKYMHTRLAAGIAVAAGVLLACVLGWQVAKRLPERKPTTETTESTEKDAKAPLPSPVTRHPSPAVAAPKPEPPAPKPVAEPAAQFEFWKFVGQKVPVPGPDGKTQDLLAGRLTGGKYSPNGKYLAVAHAFGVDLWDTQTWAVVRRLDGHTAAVTAIDFSADGARLVSGAGDKATIVWEVSSGKPVCKYAGSSHIAGVAISPDGTRVATAELYEDKVRMWNVESGKHIRFLQGHTDRVRAVAFSPDGARIASGSEDKTVRLWDAETGAELARLEGHTQAVSAVAFSPKGNILASEQPNGTVHIWDPKTGKAVQALKSAGRDDAPALTFGPSLLSFRSPAGIKLYAPDKRQDVLEVKLGSYGHRASLSPDENALAVVSPSLRTVALYEVKTGKEIRQLAPYGQPHGGLRFSPTDSRFLLSGFVGPAGPSYRLFD
ncbi:MAG: WD40 repeat domain-containing protein, partial [Planctomycetes bacterium]|nr:WD40 repeat domain-containing protein [Planctomycetota bacterium]